jgi:GNAT superfamily N-acetyltransferase
VATIEEAAYVANMTPETFRTLSTSRKVADHRRLSDVAMSEQASERILHVAHRRSSLLSVETAYPEEAYPIPSHSPRVVRGRAETSLDTINIAFNGHGDLGGKNEPSVEWIMQSLGPADNSRRIRAINSFMSPSLACAEAYGIVLEISEEGEDGLLIAAAACACYPPDGLEDDGSTMRAGSDRWFYGMATANVAPAFMNRHGGGAQMVQRLAAFKQDSRWEERRKEYGRMWYVAILGTHPAFQGKGNARQLLDVIAYWAEQTGHDCYLECSSGNVPFYERCGYESVWSSEITVEGSSITMCGMAKKIFCR